MWVPTDRHPVRRAPTAAVREHQGPALVRGAAKGVDAQPSSIALAAAAATASRESREVVTILAVPHERRAVPSMAT